MGLDFGSKVQALITSRKRKGVKNGNDEKGFCYRR